MSFTPQRSIHVVAGVITDARGRVLLTRRTEGRDLAGRWEFPGGKREADESAEAALVRELQEELGISAVVGEPVINVPQQYPDKRLRLDVRQVPRWTGQAKGREGQALAWVLPEKLPLYLMPPADRPVVAALLYPDRYLVTPAPGKDDHAWLDALDGALRQGVRRVQLRLPDIETSRRERLIRSAVLQCQRAHADVLINGDIRLARELGVGVHLRAAQLPELERRPLPDGQWVGVSCHGAEELRHAEDLGCDFAVLGSIHDTPSHPGGTTLGWDAFARLREGVSLPLYAIGGVGPEDIGHARQHGAQGIAAIRALWPQVRTAQPV
ncbi:Nudix family hydrolase [Pseudoxanthomonas dokdonensis]|uniref:8-oxo-dGTP diphosphatase n=1 Tax=Pseudoxanthomonas dokdonensis TaxID=344882 RepID=A0A0R0CX63_9GAMM|nr:Nudix family hydrolase [Pseudoxanthomonas dokdonensis]KRG69955.1 DNA mismatch repair protein MutT [Pseudoxanthomonas dokdonensis]